MSEVPTSTTLQFLQQTRFKTLSNKLDYLQFVLLEFRHNSTLKQRSGMRITRYLIIFRRQDKLSFCSFGHD